MKTQVISPSSGKHTVPTTQVANDTLMTRGLSCPKILEPCSILIWNSVKEVLFRNILQRQSHFVQVVIHQATYEVYVCRYMLYMQHITPTFHLAESIILYCNVLSALHQLSGDILKHMHAFAAHIKSGKTKSTYLHLVYSLPIMATTDCTHLSCQYLRYYNNIHDSRLRGRAELFQVPTIRCKA